MQRLLDYASVRLLRMTLSKTSLMALGGSNFHPELIISLPEAPDRIEAETSIDNLSSTLSTSNIFWS